jgi:iron complex transport system substrate-binding protein
MVQVLGVLLGMAVIAASGVVDAGSIRDHAGRDLRVSVPFDRIISLYGAHTENLFALGAEDAVIGVSPNEVYPPEARTRKVYSYHDGVEKFLAASPDLVLVRPMIERGYGSLIQQLERHGIVVVSLQPATVEEMLEYWRILGVLTGRRDNAENMAARFHEALTDFGKLSGEIDEDDRQRVYFEAIHHRMKTFRPGTMPIFALEAAGGVNIASDAPQVRTTNIAYYGKERLMSRGDEIDVYLAQSGVMNRPTIDMIREEPGFDTIRAVKNGQVYLIDETIVSRPTLRLLVGVWTIGAHLYPEVFCRRGKDVLDRAGLSAAGPVSTCMTMAQEVTTPIGKGP